MASSRSGTWLWLNRPVVRDWVFWLGLVVGFGWFLVMSRRAVDAGSDQSWIAFAVNGILFTFLGLVAVATLVGCVRQYRRGYAVGRGSRV